MNLSSSSQDIDLARNQTNFSTISRDFAQEQLAREEAALQSLGAQNRVELNAPASEARNTIGTGQPSPVVKVNTMELGRNHALEDYQMQLMLLEQQNKKRAKHEAAERERLKHPEPYLPNVPDIHESQTSIMTIPVVKEGTAWPNPVEPTTPAKRIREQAIDDPSAAAGNDPKRARGVNGTMPLRHEEPGTADGFLVC